MADGKKGVVQEIIDMGVKEMNAMAEVSDITGQFRNLLMEQMERVEKMEESAGKKKDFKSLPVITIFRSRRFVFWNLY